jgi:hypothetical protein
VAQVPGVMKGLFNLRLEGGIGSRNEETRW